ncbi:MAG: histone deacetylase family protein [Proteobacteria bacterium]|nr:histone deacetylase family protein [Pseudomonadota bacterium]
MKIIYSEAHRQRASKTELYGGELVPPFECPERVDFILKRLSDKNFGTILDPHPVVSSAVHKIHDAGYLAFLNTAWDEWQAAGFKGEAMVTVWQSRSMPATHIPDFIEGKLGYYCLAAETSISAGTAEAAWASLGVALAGTDHVLKGDRAAFALCRPPGHHASRDQYGGYCFINNAAAAAQHMRDQGLERVAILDVDFHHGNGTQAIFSAMGDELFLSLHGDPMAAFPHFLGHADETGTGAGTNYNVNYPMPAGTPYSEWRQALDNALQRIRDFAPQGVVVSLGVDTFERDPISFFKLTSDDFTDMGGRISGLGLPTVFVMEGGYAVEEIGVNTVNVLMGFEAQVS